MPVLALYKCNLQDVIGNKGKKSGQFLRFLSGDFIKLPSLWLSWKQVHFLAPGSVLPHWSFSEGSEHTHFSWHSSVPVIDIFNHGGLWPSRNCKAAFTERLSLQILLRWGWGSWLEWGVWSGGMVSELADLWPPVHSLWLLQPHLPTPEAVTSSFQNTAAE